MTHCGTHSTSDVVTVFARQGIALTTIARAMALPVERVEGMCQRAHQNGELQMIPPIAPTDTRGALLSEVSNLRVQLDDAQAFIREISNQDYIETFVGVARMTRSEAKIVATIAKHGRATKAALYHALYGGFDDDQLRDPKIVDVLVCKTRKKLKAHDIEIDTVWGIGYSMTSEAVARLNALANVPFVESPSLVPEVA